jgi:hypothetical protein
MDERRRVIDNVPKVAFAPIHDGQYEFTPFPSCLKSVTAHLGVDHAYHYLLGASGAAFRLVWHTERWEGGNVDIIFMAEDPLEPFRRALRAAGFEAEIIFNSAWQWDNGIWESRREYLADVMTGDASVFENKIIASIDRGVPVIAFGVVGPPEACIITGYDDAGKVLIGWSMFQEHLDPLHDIAEGGQEGPSGTEPSGYFRQSDWLSKLKGMIVLGERREVDVADTYRRALAWIPTIVKHRRCHEFHTGQAAYDAYIAKMLDDDEYPAGDMVTLSERRMVHYDAMTMISERGNGALFVRDIAAHPDFAGVRATLEAAADAFAEANTQMAAWWQVAGQIWSDEDLQVKATGDPRIRRAFVPHIRRAKEKDLEAADFIERALAELLANGRVQHRRRRRLKWCLPHAPTQ